MLPTLFLSHGAPSLILTDSPARTFMTGLAATLGQKPKAILMISAHWEADHPMVNAVAVNQTIYDFYGFPAPIIPDDLPGTRFGRACPAGT